jgi:uncharacterized protein (DUF2252 family)
MPSVADRIALGKTARTECPRSSHDSLGAGVRADPLLVLDHQEQGRERELLPIRHQRMAASPFAFFRGAAAVMASDLARTPVSGLRAQLCGDAHASNFGVFATPERNLAFDVNDFDETLPGPWEWDVKRLLASLELVARHCGISHSQRRDCVLYVARAYREAMADLAHERTLDVWYAHLDADQVLAEHAHELLRRQRRRTRQTLAKARTRDELQAARHHTELVDGARRFISKPPDMVPLRDQRGNSKIHLERDIPQVLARYPQSLEPSLRELLARYRLVDVAHKVVGVGSVGTRCWIALYEGRDEDDPLVLQLKQAEASVLEPYAGACACSQGERVVVGQRLMQAHSDILLGWASGVDELGQPCDYYVRQLRDWKGSFALDDMPPSSLEMYGHACAWTLARAHARSGDRVAIAAYLGRKDSFDRAVATFASDYADQTERDHDAFVAAIRYGRLAA